MYIANKGDSYEKGINMTHLIHNFSWTTRTTENSVYLIMSGREDTISYRRKNKENPDGCTTSQIEKHIIMRVKELLERSGWSFYKLIEK